MLAQLVYLIRAAFAACFLVFGLILILNSLASPKKTAYSMGVPVVIAVGGALAWPRRPNAWRRDKPTEKQLAYAKALGIPLRPGLSKGEVSDLISEFKDAI